MSKTNTNPIEKQTILIVEDEAAIREMLNFTLIQAGFNVIEASNAEQAWNLLLKHHPDCILLDWILPGFSGVSVLSRIRQNKEVADTPIIMLTAKNEEDNQIKCFEAGVDDYVAKPFSPRTLVFRIKALLRRLAPEDSTEVVSLGHLTFHQTKQRFFVSGQEVLLKPTELKLMQFFMTHTNRVYSRIQILDTIWGENIIVEERTVDVHIRRLRINLEPHQADKFIQTVRGVGYRFSID